MQRLLVMTVIGPDRPGLVDAIAGLVAEHGGNWLESRMSRLGGQFAGILRVEVAADREAGLVAALKGLAPRGLAAVIHPDQPTEAKPSGRLSVIEIVGQDRPGIVKQISRVLADYNVNVEELQTERASAAMSGEPLFKARARISIPDSCDVGEIRQKLEKIAEDLIVDFSFADVVGERRE